MGTICPLVEKSSIFEEGYNVPPTKVKNVMANESIIKLFEDKKIRIVWNEEEEKYYFAVADIVQVLTDSADVMAYWRKLKQRLKAEGNETVTNCHALKLPAADE